MANVPFETVKGKNRTKNVSLTIFMQITGKITYVDLSGGFWGIVGDDGQKYNPLDSLPSSFQQEGMKVKAEITHSHSFSIFMWGKNVNLVKVEKV